MSLHKKAGHVGGSHDQPAECIAVCRGSGLAQCTSVDCSRAGCVLITVFSTINHGHLKNAVIDTSGTVNTCQEGIGRRT